MKSANRLLVFMFSSLLIELMLLPSLGSSLNVVEPPTFNPETYIIPYDKNVENRDLPGLTLVWNLVKENYDQYNQWSAWMQRAKNNSETPVCIDVAFNLGDEIKDSLCTNPAFDKWEIDTITTNGPCHDAIMVSSPKPPLGEGKYYLVDPYVNDHRIYEMKKDGKKYIPVKEPHWFWTCAKQNHQHFEILWENIPVPGRKAPLPPLIHWVCPLTQKKEEENDVNLTQKKEEENDVHSERACPGVEAGPTSNVQVVASLDPNDKVGSQSIGAARYMSGDQPLRYSIYFENIETASAPAQEVIVTDQLDAGKLDLTTLSLGPISFGDRLITPVISSNEFTADVDLRPQNNIIVKIIAKLDPQSGVLSWHFTSIDPETGELPEDPFVGFLPPNTSPPEGDGSVVFMVFPKTDLSTGTQIRNKAEIFFDANAPMVTQEWFNTLDNTRPTSSVVHLAPEQNATDFLVNWSGADIGSGIKDYTIFVSEDGGPFTEWLRKTTSTSELFSGKYDKTYSFYSLARDLTGNIEDRPATPDASTVLMRLIGDLDGDGDIDQDDLNILLGDRNKVVSQSKCGSSCDLDGDGKITSLDARKLTVLCTRPRCATQ